MSSLTYDKAIPYFKKGFHLDQTWFSGGRIGVSMARHGGISKVVYFGRQAMPNRTFFESKFPQSSWEKLLRLCVLIDGHPYYPEFNQTRLYPFGYTSECLIQKVHFQHELLLLNDTIVHRVKVLSNPLKRSLSLKLIFHGFTRTTPGCRKWTPWVEESGTIITSATETYSPEECKQQVITRKKNPSQAVTFENPDVPKAETHLGIASNTALSIEEIKPSDFDKKSDGWKYYLRSRDFTKQGALFVCFNPEKNALLRRIKHLQKQVFTECDTRLREYDTRLQNSPEIQLRNPSVQSCLVNIPPVLDSLKIADIPGGLRAGATDYWMWSWDSLVHSSVYIYSDDIPFLKDLLLLVNKYTDFERLGIPHLVTTRLQPLLAMAFPPQCIYILALYNYYYATHDKQVLKKCYPLATWLIERCLSKEVGNTGLIEGVAYYPDFPEYLGQHGQDISVINNSIFYQGVMALRCLTQEMLHLSPSPEQAQFIQKLESIGNRCRASFIKYFFDQEKGYFVDSVDSRTFVKRPHYPAHAILWISHFAADLLGEHADRIASFMIKNFSQKHGPAMYPEWDSCFMKDGNQLGAYYAVTEPFFRNVLKQTGRTRELNKWFDNLAWFWARNTLPEGFTYDAVNEGFTPDNPGGKQAFCAKSWYDIFFRTIVGLELDERGLVVTPSPGIHSVCVRNVRIGGKRLDIKTVRGAKPSIKLNGRLVGVPGIIPLTQLKAVNQLTIVSA